MMLLSDTASPKTSHEHEWTAWQHAAGKARRSCGSCGAVQRCDEHRWCCWEHTGGCEHRTCRTCGALDIHIEQQGSGM